MFETIPFLYEILWASFGLVLYKIVSRVFDYGRTSLLIKEMVTRCLALIGTMVEELAFIHELKYKTMHESNIDEKQIELIKEIDEQTLRTWKDNVAMAIVNSFPKEFQSIVGFSTWDEAIKKLNNFHKSKRR
tara:strand:- start:683 stop:1078 length:396 start_codon:yes stop_codon:yes gene_type:complete